VHSIAGQHFRTARFINLEKRHRRRVVLTEKPRDRHDVIIVQEKLDGSNVAIAKVDGQLIPIGRAGYPAVSSKYEQHRLFHNWAMSQP